MLFFTYISNKFGIAVEFLHKNLSIIVKRLSVFCFLSFFAVQAVFPPPFAMATSPLSKALSDGGNLHFLSADSQSLAVRLVCGEISDGNVTLKLSLAGVSLCGLWAEVSYDASRVSVSSVELNETISRQGGTLSFSDSGGRLALLLDSCNNCFLGDVAELVFKFADSVEVETLFEVTVLSACAWLDEALVALPLCEPSAVAVSTNPTVNGEAPAICAVEISTFGDEALLSVSGRFPEKCFAAGFELIIADLSSFIVERVCAVGVIRQGEEERGFVKAIRIPANGRFCAIFKPVSYSRTGVIAGGEIILLIEDGEILN